MRFQASWCKLCARESLAFGRLAERYRPRGVVTIEMRPGQSSYPATLRNGVSSQGFGAYSKSFAVVTR